MSKRPIIDIAPTSVDKKVDLAILITTVITVLLPVLAYTKLPDQIPSHFDIAGNIDGYASKHIIWVIPIISVVTYFLLKYLLGKPHIFNYPAKVTKENAETLYRQGIKMIRYLLLFTQLVYLFITVAIVFGGLYEGKSLLGPWFTIGVLLIGVLFPIGMAFKMADS